LAFISTAVLLLGSAAFHKLHRGHFAVWLDAIVANIAAAGMTMIYVARSIAISFVVSTADSFTGHN
jgi:hypothetical protein